MANYKVPSQAASGSDSFSDGLVGNQITNGSNQLTNTNFTIDKTIPEKDSKEFRSEPFSEFITLDDIKEETVELNSLPNSVKEDIKFKNNKNNASRALYGSLKQRIGVSITNIIQNYPAAVLIDSNSPSGLSSLTAESITYDIFTNTTEFYTQYSFFYNPLDVNFITPKSNTLPESKNTIRDFYSSFTRYVIEQNNVSYDILEYSEPNVDNKIRLKVAGGCFFGLTEFTSDYIIRPNNGVTETFYSNLDDLETVLLNRETTPKFQANFNVPRETNNGFSTDLVSAQVNWPINRDGWNIQVSGLDYEYYVFQLVSLAEEIDEYKSNLIVRFLTAPQLFEFDTSEKKGEAIFQIYGQSFDKIKKFIDNIAFMRNVSYDGIDNVPDILLKNLSETLGFKTVNLFDEKSLEDSLYSRHDSQYKGVGSGMNLIESEYEFYRRILTNLAYLYKSKGTRTSIEFFLKFIGAPEPMIRLDEFVYKVTNTLPSENVEDDIWDAIQGVKKTYVATYNTTTSGYTITLVSNTTTLNRDEYPVDEKGLPRKITSSDGSMFFQKGEGWYKKTIDHRSSDILDTFNSNLTGRTKIIKTISKPFTYGEDYFNEFRKLAGLDYGFDLSSKIDNKKTEIVEDSDISKMTLNRKNMNVFLSSDRVIDYDIYRKSRDLSSTFHTLEPQTGVTFVEFLDNVLHENVKNSHVSRYKKTYPSLKEIYKKYSESNGFTPYNFISVNEFINKLGPYWVNIVEQFVPATTLWMGGNLIENGVFGRSKYAHRQPCQPKEFNEVLYPDFEITVREDLVTIIGGGFLDSFRGVQHFSGVSFNIALEINGITHEKTTNIIKPFVPFIPTTGCTNLIETSDSIPLICDFNGNYLDFNNSIITTFKTEWKNTLNEIINEINTGDTQSVNVEYYIDKNGVEKVKFITHSSEYYGCNGTDTFHFYYDPIFELDKQECSINVDVTTDCLIYTGDVITSPLVTDLHFVISDATGDESGDPSVLPIYVHLDCEDDGNPIEITRGGDVCEYILSEVHESDEFNFIFTDAGNCERKLKIDGLEFRTVYLDGGLTGYTITPKVIYKPSYNYGIRKGTMVYKSFGVSTPPSTYTELESMISLGTMSGVTIESVSIGDSLLSMELKPYSGLTASQFENKDINGFQFAFDYKLSPVENIDCLSSIKTDVINDNFEILPTSKVLVYTNRNDDLDKVPYHFEYKFPEHLFTKPIEEGLPCCENVEVINGDFLINQDGFGVEVSSVELNYCSIDNHEKIYYQLNVSGQTENTILFNGGVSGGDCIILSFERELITNANDIVFYPSCCVPPVITSVECVATCNVPTIGEVSCESCPEPTIDSVECEVCSAPSIDSVICTVSCDDPTINTVGGGTYYNSYASRTFTKNDCGGGLSGSTETYSVSGATYSSVIGQLDADNKALADINANGQSYVNSIGSCTGVPIVYYGYNVKELTQDISHTNCVDVGLRTIANTNDGLTLGYFYPGYNGISDCIFQVLETADISAGGFLITGLMDSTKQSLCRDLLPLPIS
jgi:hypothetical protein